MTIYTIVHGRIDKITGNKISMTTFGDLGREIKITLPTFSDEVTDEALRIMSSANLTVKIKDATIYKVTLREFEQEYMESLKR